MGHPMLSKHAFLTIAHYMLSKHGFVALGHYMLFKHAFIAMGHRMLSKDFFLTIAHHMLLNTPFYLWVTTCYLNKISNHGSPHIILTCVSVSTHVF